VNYHFSVMDSASGVQSFSPQFRINGGAWQALQGDGNSRSIPSAAGGAVIDFRASAVDKAGNTRQFPDAPDSTTRVDLTPPGFPGGLQVQARAGGAFRVSWTAPTADNGAPVQSYVLQHQAPGGTFQDLATPVGTNHTAEGPALDSATHAFRVAAVDAAGNQGAFTGPQSGVAHNRAPEGVLVASTTSHGSPAPGGLAAFQWNALQGGPGETLRYRYAVTGNATHSFAASDPSTTLLQVQVPVTNPGTWYFHVGGVGAGGLTAAAPVAFEVLPAIDLSQVAAYNRGIKVTSTDVDGGALVSWALPDNPPATVAGVQIWRIDDGGLVLVATLPADQPDFLKGSWIDPNGGQEYVVTAYYADSLGEFSATAPPGKDHYTLSSASDERARIRPWAMGPVLFLALGGLVAGIVFVVRRPTR
jgi:hypothetical protein